MDDMLREILPDFIAETSELLDKLDQNFLELEGNPGNLDILNEIFRYAHTIKGSSAIFDFAQMNRLAHRMENVLDRMRKEELETTGTIIDVMLQSLDLLKRLLDDVKEESVQERDLGGVLDLLDRINAGEDVSGDVDGARAAAGDPAPREEPAAAEAAEEPAGEAADEPGGAAAGADDADAGDDDGGMDEMLKEVLPEFINETGELLDQLDGNFVDLERNPGDLDLLNTIFRAAHTIKGSSSLFGFEAISTLAHRMENVLDRLRNGELKVVPAMADVLLAGTDKLKEMLGDVQAQGRVGEHDTADLIAELERFNAMEAAGGGEAAAPPEVPNKGSVMKEMREKAAAEGAPDSGTPAEPAAEKKAEPEAAPKPKKGGLTITEVGGGAGKAEAAEAPRKPAPKGILIQEVTGKKAAAAPRTGGRTVDPTIRVNISRLDNLMNLAGELILGRNRLIQISKDMKGRMQSDKDVDQLSDLSAQIDLLTTDIQMAIMKTRMLSVQHIFSKFPRMIRDLSRKKGKQINLVISGEETELDKSVLEDINDPLVHIIRNSVDHGIEDPDTREAAGKPAAGTVKISAYHEGNHIVIKIEDDGKGMDARKIAAKAVEKGVIKADDVDKMSKRELLNLIFAPGFSTAEKVSDISGRGVGMDVVRTNIEKMKGTIDLSTEPGKGTVIHIKIPLTLAIIQALLVRVADEIYAIPVLSVTEIVRLEKDGIDSVYGQEVIRLRDDVFPIIRLAELFEFGQEGTGTEFIIMVSLAEQKFGLVVGSIIGEQEVVVKPLGNYLGKSRGLAGASIMGDGRVCLILDIGTLAELINEQKRDARKKAS